jgi:hypothetical protein
MERDPIGKSFLLVFFQKRRRLLHPAAGLASAAARR